MGLPFSIRLAFFALAVAAAGCTSPNSPGGESESGNRAGVTSAADSPRSAGDSSAATPDKTENGGKATRSGRFKINVGQSRLVAGVLVGGMFSKLGHDHAILMRKFAGEVDLPSDSMEKGSLRMTIKADSAAEIAKEFSEKDRQKIDKSVREEALMTGKYPEITFKSTKSSPGGSAGGAHRMKLAGNLSLHGVTRPIVITVQVTVSGNTLHAHSEFTILHSDYQIKRLSAAGGTIKAKDPIHITCDFVADRE